MYAPLAYYRQGLRLVESEGLPIAGYDELDVKEIGDRLDGMSAAEIRTVGGYEKRNKNRETLIEQFDRKLRAASAQASGNSFQPSYRVRENSNAMAHKPRASAPRGFPLSRE
jgi:hypothetical protein